MASDNTMKCVKIIENPNLPQRKKIGLLKRIFSQDPACVFQPVQIPDEMLSSYTHTLLHVAVYAGFASVVKLLLDHGADVHSKNSFDDPPIFAACNYYNQRNVQVLQLLIRYGADVNVKDEDGETPLSYSVLCRNGIKITDVLLNHGAKVTPRSLLCSLTFQNEDAAKLLIKHLLIENPDTEKPSFLDNFYYLSVYWDAFMVMVVNELFLMKKNKLGNSIISVYDIFVADESMLARYMGNEAVQEFIISDYVTLFPIHAHIIKKQCQVGMTRRIFESQVHIVMNHWQPSLFNLGIHQRIFEQLGIQDLKNLREAGLSTLSNTINTDFKQS